MGLFDSITKYAPLGMFTDPKNNELAKALGLSGAQEEYFKPTATPEMQQMPGGANIQAFDSPAFNEAISRSRAGNDMTAQNNLAQYGQGNMSTADAINQAGGLYGGDKAAQAQYLENLATDPLSGSRFATDQVQNNPLLSKALSGMEGLNDSIKSQRGRADAEEQDLASRGYSLKPEDYEAYGQASGDLARLFGSQEQDLSQSLAARGLSQGASGASMAGFAGLQGNKMEQLAGLQRQIADNRMKSNMDRLSQTRSYLTNLNSQEQSGRNQYSSQANQMVNDQYGRQLAGAQNSRAGREFGVSADMGKYAQDSQNKLMQNQQAMQSANNTNQSNLGLYDSLNNANQASFASKQANKGATLNDALGRGLFKTTEAAPGMAAKYATGGAG